MVASAMTRATDRPEPHPTILQDLAPEAYEPLDYLVNALNRAVARRQATERNETENRT
jgi:hypothetical protein